MSLKAVIFDMDGLLLDSERIALKMFLQVCEQLGATPNQEAYLSCIGSNATRTRELLIEGHGSNFPLDEVLCRWEEAYQQQVYEHPVPLKVGVVELLKAIRYKGVPMAIATSTAFEKACVKLGNAGLRDYFKVIVAGDQVAKSKPNPEIYLKAAEKLGVAAVDCLALEDSDNGVRAAHRAGMRVVQIPDLVQPSEAVKALDHQVFSSLKEVVKRLDALLKA